MITDATLVEELHDSIEREARLDLTAAGVEPVHRTIRAFVEGWQTSAKSSMQAVGVIKVWLEDDGETSVRVRTRTDIHPYTPHRTFPVVTAIDTVGAIATGLDGETAQAYMLGWGRGLLDRERPT